MILMKRKTSIVGITVLILAGLGVYAGMALRIPDRAAAGAAEMRYIADFSDDRNVLGSSQHAFVAIVTRKLDQTDVAGVPFTEYEAEAVYNIKGSLQGKIILLQPTELNGYKYPLEIGSTYLFATRYDTERDAHVISTHPNMSMLLSGYSGMSVAEIAAVAKDNDKVGAWEEAYKHEILLPWDIESGNTLNSYQSVEKDSVSR